MVYDEVPRLYFGVYRILFRRNPIGSVALEGSILLSDRGHLLSDAIEDLSRIYLVAQNPPRENQ